MTDRKKKKKTTVTSDFLRSMEDAKVVGSLAETLVLRAKLGSIRNGGKLDKKGCYFRVAREGTVLLCCPPFRFSSRICKVQFAAPVATDVVSQCESSNARRSLLESTFDYCLRLKPYIPRKVSGKQ